MPEATKPGAGALAALKDAGGAALVAAALSFPIVALATVEDINQKLVLEQRWSWVVGAAAMVFVGRLATRAPGAAVVARWALFALAAVVAAYFVSASLDIDADWPAPLILAVIVGAAGFAALALSAPFSAASAARAKQRALRADLAARAGLLRFAGLAALIIFPLFALWLLGPQGSLKWINNYGIQILIYVMLGWGLNIVVGLAGLLDLGYVAFYAVGAYTYALLSTTYGWSFWICLPLAGIFAACWGILLGVPVLRLRGDYLAIVTLGFGEIIRVVLINWSDLTNGYAGVSSIPRVTFFGVPFIDDDSGFAARFGLEFSPIHRTIFLFYLILALALLTNAATLRLRRLPIGRAWEALREDEIACRSLGINTVNTKLTAFALGAGFAGFAGAFFAVRQNFVSPESFTFPESATILAIVVLGGMGSQLGVAAAAFALIGGMEMLRELDFLKQIFGDGFDPAQYRMLVFGLAMVTMMIWKPRGVVSSRAPSIFLKTRAAVSGDHVGEGRG